MTKEERAAPHEAHVKAHGLGRRYGTHWALRDATFTVPKGRIFGIIGPNGAGKSTTLKILAGLLEPSEGTAEIAGTRVGNPELKARIGYLPEESPVYEDMTPVQYLRFFADLYEVPKNVAEERIEKLLTDLKLEVRTERKNGDLSKGQRRKVAIARSLINDPDLLIYDEPASGLDTVASAYILDLVKRLREQGKTVIFSAHNLYHVERICDHILMIHRGREIMQGDMAAIREKAGGTEYRVRLTHAVEGAVETPEGYEVTVTDFQEIAALERRIAEAGGRVLDVRTTELPLEEIFLRATHGDGTGATG